MREETDEDTSKRTGRVRKTVLALTRWMGSKSDEEIEELRKQEEADLLRSFWAEHGQTRDATLGLLRVLKELEDTEDARAGRRTYFGLHASSPDLSQPECYGAFPPRTNIIPSKEMETRTAWSVTLSCVFEFAVWVDGDTYGGNGPRSSFRSKEDVAIYFEKERPWVQPHNRPWQGGYHDRVGEDPVHAESIADRLGIENKSLILHRETIPFGGAEWHLSAITDWLNKYRVGDGQAFVPHEAGLSGYPLQHTFVAETDGSSISITEHRLSGPYYMLDTNVVFDWRDISAVTWVNPATMLLCGKKMPCVAIGVKLSQPRRLSGRMWVTDPRGEYVSVDQAVSELQLCFHGLTRPEDMLRHLLALVDKNLESKQEDRDKGQVDRGYDVE